MVNKILMAMFVTAAVAFAPIAASAQTPMAPAAPGAAAPAPELEPPGFLARSQGLRVRG